MKNQKQSYTLLHTGTHQSDRYPKALDGSYIPIDERTLPDLVEQMALYAKYVKYYNEHNQHQGDWTDFFEEIYDYKLKKVRFTSIEALESKASTSPHLAVLLSFLHLYLKEIEALNTITDKHLDFYYSELLRLKKRAAQPDKAVVTFELKKDQSSVQLPQGSHLFAQQDEQGKEVLYSTLSELEILPATISDIEEVRKITASSAVNTFDTFVISSALFNLTEGRRKITIDMRLSIPVNDSTFEVEYSGPKAWEKPYRVRAKNIDNKLCRLIILISKKQAAFTPANTVHGLKFEEEAPLLKIRLNKKNREFWSYFVPSCVESIFTSVNGAKTLCLQNDFGKIDTNTISFKPFGPIPKKGYSTLLIGHKDIFNKFLRSFHIAMSWKDLGYKNLKYQIKRYNKLLKKYKLAHLFDIRDLQNFSFGHPPGDIEILDEGKWKKLPINEQHDFTKNRELYQNKYYTQKHELVSYPLQHNIQSYKEGYQTGFVRMKLNIDFGHQVYPELIKFQAYNQNRDNVAKKYKHVPKPYVPEFNTLHIDYEASSSDQKDFKCFYSNSFGYKVLNRVDNIRDDVGLNVDADREVYIGVQDFHAPATLHLYMQLDASVSIETPLNEEDLSWSVLKNNTWTKIEANAIVVNTTKGFMQSGLIGLRFLNLTSASQTLMPANKTWIRLSFNTDKCPKIKKIYTNAVMTACVLSGRDLPHLAKGLAKNTISKLQMPIQSIKLVTQPDVSFDGVPQETTKDYRTRISEQLRHKNRAWNIWDYERLVLSEFKDIMFAKCFCCAQDKSKVNIMLIPKGVFDIAESSAIKKVAPVRKREIQRFLQMRTSPFVSVDIQDPKYEILSVACKVKLHPDYTNIRYYENKLNQALVNFLTPYRNETYSPKASLYISNIIAFIESQDYVDWIQDIKVSSDYQDFKRQDMLVGFQPNAVLISLPEYNDIHFE